jgi:hypothetical protein
VTGDPPVLRGGAILSATEPCDRRVDGALDPRIGRAEAGGIATALGACKRSDREKLAYSTHRSSQRAERPARAHEVSRFGQRSTA